MYITGTDLRHRIGLQFFAEEETAGANEQEPAEPAPDETAETGANEQEPAEPAPQEENQQSAEDNSRFAAARRRAEAQFNERLQAERQRATDEAFRRVFEGQLNPYTNRPITNEREYQEYRTAYEREQMQQSGIDPDMLNRMIENNPTVQQAREVVNKARDDAANRALAEQIAEIGRLDPTVKDIETLMHHENAEQFNALVKRGYSLPDAFRLANFETLTGKKAAAAKQQALNNVNSKGHLAKTAGGKGGEDVIIPPEAMGMLKHAFPKLTHDQLVEKYKKFK